MPPRRTKAKVLAPPDKESSTITTTASFDSKDIFPHSATPYEKQNQLPGILSQSDSHEESQSSSAKQKCSKPSNVPSLRRVMKNQLGKTQQCLRSSSRPGPSRRVPISPSSRQCNSSRRDLKVRYHLRKRRNPVKAVQEIKHMQKTIKSRRTSRKQKGFEPSNVLSPLRVMKKAITEQCDRSSTRLGPSYRAPSSLSSKQSDRSPSRPGPSHWAASLPVGRNLKVRYHRRKRRDPVKAIQEMKYTQKTATVPIQKTPFLRLVREIVTSVTETHFYFQVRALLALQEASEAYLIGHYEDAILYTLNAKLVTLMQQGIHN